MIDKARQKDQNKRKMRKRKDKNNKTILYLSSLQMKNKMHLMLGGLKTTVLAKHIRRKCVSQDLTLSKWSQQLFKNLKLKEEIRKEIKKNRRETREAYKGEIKDTYNRQIYKEEWKDKKEIKERKKGQRKDLQRTSHHTKTN